MGCCYQHEKKVGKKDQFLRGEGEGGNSEGSRERVYRRGGERLLEGRSEGCDRGGPRSGQGKMLEEAVQERGPEAAIVRRGARE